MSPLFRLVPLALAVALSADAQAGPDPHRDAAYAAHVAALRERLPAGFTVVVEKPFVVIGDMSPRAVKKRARGTVRWATSRLKALYFDKDPPRILDIWLFGSKASYEKHTRELFGDAPTTPYGWYSPSDGALIMNIATGGGTLVHELVHPYVEANFPDAPPWLNEGLGSLYEHAGDEGGRIVGKLNWRLPGLQEAIVEGPLMSFRALMAQDDDAFYERDPGTNYGQSRYLCYWLQERGLLVKVYREMLAARAHDPSGYETFVRVVGIDDAVAWQRQWEKWVLTLRR